MTRRAPRLAPRRAAPSAKEVLLAEIAPDRTSDRETGRSSAPGHWCRAANTIIAVALALALLSVLAWRTGGIGSGDPNGPQPGIL